MKCPADIKGEQVLGDEVLVSQVNEALRGFLDLHPGFDICDSRHSPQKCLDSVPQVVDEERGGRLVGGQNCLGGQALLVSYQLQQGRNAVGCGDRRVAGCEKEDGTGTCDEHDDSSGERFVHFWPFGGRHHIRQSRPS